MSIEAIFWAFNQRISNPGAKLVLLTLSNYANESHQSYPSQEKISELTGISTRAIRNHIHSLEEQGILTRVHRSVDGKYFSDLFTLCIPAAESADGKICQEPAAKSATYTKRVIHKENKSKRTRVPDDFEPNQKHYDFAGNNELVMSEQLEAFIDHHKAKGSLMDDWDAAFRTWLRNAVKFRKPQEKKKTNWRDDLKHTADLLTGRIENATTFLD